MKGLLSKFEYIVIGVLALIFLIWTASKCNAHKEQAQDAQSVVAAEDSIAQAANKPANALPPIPQQTQAAPQAQTSNPGVYQPINGEQPAANPNTGNASQPAQPQASTAQTPQPEANTNSGGLSRLYVTIDKLKVRKTPGLKGESLGELKLFDEVYYMNETTDSLYEVNLGREMAKEPYVKIKTKRGTVGWVYGAGVHYIKKKRSGTLN